MVAELFVEREAVFFELSSTLQTGLPNIFQDRSIQLLPRSDDSVLVSSCNNICSPHAPTPYALSDNNVLEHQRPRRLRKMSASDIVAYRRI